MRPPDFPIGPQVSDEVADLIRHDPTISDARIAAELGLPIDHPCVQTDLILGRLVSQESCDQSLLMRLMARQRENITAATAIRVMSILEEEGLTEEDLRKHLRISDLLLEGKANYAPVQLGQIARLWSFLKELAGDLSVETEEIIWMSADYLSRGLTEEQVKDHTASKIRSEVRREIEGDTPNGQTSGSNHNLTP